MRNVNAILRLTVVAQVHAQELAPYHTTHAQDAVHKLISRSLEVPRLPYTHLDSIMFGKGQQHSMIKHTTLPVLGSSKLNHQSWQHTVHTVGPPKLQSPSCITQSAFELHRTKRSVQAAASEVGSTPEVSSYATRRAAGAKNIVVLGGSSGIGQATVRALLARGHRVFATGRYEGNRYRQLIKFEEDLSSGRNVLCAQDYEQDWCLESESDGILKVSVGDVGNEEDVARQIKEAMSFFDNRLDGVVNSAGCGAGRRNFETVPLEDIDNVLHTNIRGAHLWSQAALRIMKPQGSGQLVFIGSCAGIRPSSLQATYAASKWAIQGLALSLRAELKGTGVKVGLINPGTTATRWWSARSRGGYGGYTEAEIEEIKARGAYWTSMLSPDDVAHAVATMIDQPPSCNMENIVLDFSDSGGYAPPESGDVIHDDAEEDAA